MTILADIGESVTTITFTRTYDAYGVPTNTGSTVNSITAYITILDANDEAVKSGVLNAGDARLYVSPNDVTKIGADYIVEYQSKQYQVVGEPKKYSLGGTANHVEADLKRFHKP